MSSEAKPCGCKDATAPTITDALTIVDVPQLYLNRNRPQFKEARHVELQDLIKRADEYVTISAEGEATVASAIKKTMSRNEVDWVEHMVTIHNAMVKKYRFPVGKPLPPDKEPAAPPVDDSDTATTTAALGGAPEPCVPHVTITFYWWGFRIYMDHCFCMLLRPFGAVSGVAGTIMALLAAAGISVANPYIGLAAGLIAMMIGWITWADGYCTPNSGANYNQSWTVQGWITTVC